MTIYRSSKLLHFHKYCTPSQAHISNLQIATSPCYPRHTLVHMHSLHRFIYVCLILHFILFSHSRNFRSVQTTEASLHVNVVHVMPTLRSTETKYVKPTIIVYRLDIILLLIYYYRPTIIRSILITIFKCIACLSPSVLISRHIRLKTTMLTPVCKVSLSASRRCRVRRTVSSGVRAPRRVLGGRVSLSFDRVRHRQPSVDSRAFGRLSKTVTHVS